MPMNAISTITEGVLLASATIYQMISAVSDKQADTLNMAEDWWNRLTGVHGALFAMSVAVVVLWGSALSDKRDRAKADAERHEREAAALRKIEEREDGRRLKEAEERERRHMEAMDLQRKLAETTKEMAVEAIKARMEATISNHKLAEEFANLTKVISASPCLATGELRKHIAAKLGDLPMIPSESESKK